MGEIEKQKTISYLEMETPKWLELKTRMERSEGLDAHLNAQWKQETIWMDTLLEDLFTQNVILGS